MTASTRQKSASHALVSLITHKMTRAVRAATRTRAPPPARKTRKRSSASTTPSASSSSSEASVFVVSDGESEAFNPSESSKSPSPEAVSEPESEPQQRGAKRKRAPAPAGKGKAKAKTELIDIEDLGSSVHRPHALIYHSTSDIAAAQDALLDWFEGVRDARGMPWRKRYDAGASIEAKGQRAYEVSEEVCETS